MKRFRFRPDSLLRFKRRGLEAAEAELGILEQRRRSSLERARRLGEEQRLTARRTASAGRWEGAQLRASSQWIRRLLDDQAAARAAAARLESEAAQARETLVDLRRQVRLLERLRERRFTLHQAAVDKELQILADDLHQARLRREAASNDRPG